MPTTRTLVFISILLLVGQPARLPSAPRQASRLPYKSCLPRLQCHFAGLFQGVAAVLFADEHQKNHGVTGFDVAELFAEPVERVNLLAGIMSDHHAVAQSRV